MTFFLFMFRGEMLPIRPEEITPENDADNKEIKRRRRMKGEFMNVKS